MTHVKIPREVHSPMIFRKKFFVLLGPLSLLLGCGSDPAPTPAADASRSDASDASDVALDTPAPERPDAAPCIVPQDTDAGLPNLTPHLVASSIQIQRATFSATNGEVLEGCTLPGSRRLLRFTLQTPNVGDGDLYLGPPTDEGRPRCGFEWSPVHRHYHLLGYADYRLFGMDDREIARGHKQSFCFEDSRRLTTGPQIGQMYPAAELYNCGNMGIHHGWLDEYGRHLGCQYIDITNVPPGHYRIHATINGLHTIQESDYTDNQTDLEVDIPEDPDGGGMMSMDPTLACASESTGVERDCGWDVAGSFGCIPEQRVTVGCNPMCTERLGACEGNPQMRICAGDFPCMHAQALEGGESDDSCGGQCAQGSFTCPAGGRYTVMIAGHTSGIPAICQVESIAQPLPPQE